MCRTAKLCTLPNLSCKLSQRGAQFILSIFILSIFLNLYVFRATMYPSSGETTVFLRHLVLVNLCGMQGGMNTVVPPDDGPRVARNI